MTYSENYSNGKKHYVESIFEYDLQIKLTLNLKLGAKIGYSIILKR